MKPEKLLITAQYVREALDQLIQSSSNKRTNPLQLLYLVEDYLLTADFSFFQNPRQFALNEILISIIHNRYEQQRALYDLSTPPIGIGLSVATAMIKEDALLGRPDLLGWTWTYFHYIEPNLDISQQRFCEIVSLDSRTIRRYQNNTIDQLTNDFIRLEQQAREIHRKRLLLLQLPHRGSVSNLLERESEIAIVRESNYKHYSVVGAPGVGKTRFVELCIQVMVDNDDLDHVIWFNLPENLEYIEDHLRERLLVENTNISLAEYVSLKRIAIVIDGCEYLLRNTSKLTAFLQSFSNAFVFLISSTFNAIAGCLQLRINELSPAGAKALLRQVNLDSESFDFDQRFWQQIGGNPLAIQLLGQNWAIFDIHTATASTLDQVFSNLFLSLTTSERLAWLMLALLNNDFVAIYLEQLESPYVSKKDFVNLARVSIATFPSDDYGKVNITNSAQQFIELRYLSDPDLRMGLDELVRSINASSISNDLSLALVESILSKEWVAVDGELSMSLTRQFWKMGVFKSHFAVWHAILSKYGEESAIDRIDLAIAYGICQRYLGRWKQAYATFTIMARLAGMNGDFSHQAEALVELAILMRYQGDYRGASGILEHVELLPKENLAAQLQDRLIIEQIELALEGNLLDKTVALLNQLSDDIPRKKVLMIELSAKTSTVQLGFEAVEGIAQDLLQRFSASSSIVARLHILLARIAEHQQKDIESAIRHLTIALNVLIDQDNDPFALARAQSNLAAVFIKVGRLEDAQELLTAAKRIQHQIGDRVGLAVTIHSEHVIDRKIVN